MSSDNKFSGMENQSLRKVMIFKKKRGNYIHGFLNHVQHDLLFSTKSQYLHTTVFS